MIETVSIIKKFTHQENQRDGLPVVEAEPVKRGPHGRDRRRLADVGRRAQQAALLGTAISRRKARPTRVMRAVAERAAALAVDRDGRVLGPVLAADFERHARPTRRFDGDRAAQDADVGDAEARVRALDLLDERSRLREALVLGVGLLGEEAHRPAVAAAGLLVSIPGPAAMPGKTNHERRQRPVVVLRPVQPLRDVFPNRPQVHGVGRSGRIIDGGSGGAHWGCRLVGTDHVHRQIRDRNCIAVSISSPSTFRNWRALERCPVRAGERCCPVKVRCPAKTRCPSE